MKEVARNSMSVIYETEKGNTVGIVQDECNGFRKYYHVVVRKPNEYGKIVKTRCTFEKAYAIAQQY